MRANCRISLSKPLRQSKKKLRMSQIKLTKLLKKWTDLLWQVSTLVCLNFRPENLKRSRGRLLRAKNESIIKEVFLF